MEYINSDNIIQKNPTAITLGNFDGIHLGHRALIDITKRKAACLNIKSVVFSFFPHPMFMFGNRETAAVIVSSSEKRLILEKMGVDIYIEYPFTKEFASMDPEKFASEIIFERMNCKVLVVGYDYHFGKGAKGNYDLLKEIGQKYGAEVIKVPSVNLYGERVSSTKIRQTILSKDMELANELLTEPYFVYGKVTSGRHIGRTIDFPTANIQTEEHKLLPPDGVYATKTEVDGKIYQSMTNVGTNPTVNGAERTVETNIFGFNKEIYGKYIKTYFFSFIRDEVKFSSSEQLSERLRKDKLETVNYFLSEEFRKWENKY